VSFSIFLGRLSSIQLFKSVDESMDLVFLVLHRQMIQLLGLKASA